MTTPRDLVLGPEKQLELLSQLLYVEKQCPCGARPEIPLQLHCCKPSRNKGRPSASALPPDLNAQRRQREATG